jgi:hypothetical protein
MAAKNLKRDLEEIGEAISDASGRGICVDSYKETDKGILYVRVDRESAQTGKAYIIYKVEFKEVDRISEYDENN